MKLTHPSDIPANWPILLARKKTKVRIRPSDGIETFKVAWQDSELTSDPVQDLIVIQPNGKEYPCKKNIFAETYEDDLNGFWTKKELSKLVQVPEGESVQIEALEGTIKDVRYPDYIAIGKRDELYANAKSWVDENLTFI